MSATHPIPGDSISAGNIQQGRGKGEISNLDNVYGCKAGNGKSQEEQKRNYFFHWLVDFCFKGQKSCRKKNGVHSSLFTCRTMPMERNRGCNSTFFNENRRKDQKGYPIAKFSTKFSLLQEPLPKSILSNTQRS